MAGAASKRLQLAMRLQLVEERAAQFDRVYETMIRSEAMLFEDAAVRARYGGEITFSGVAMHLGCGPVHLRRSRCEFLHELTATREYEGCVLLTAKDVLVPLPRCDRAWALKAAPPDAPCAPDADCRLCSLMTARHEAALLRLRAECAQRTRFVALKVLISAPETARAWDALNKGELYVESCRQLPRKHACALLLDTRRGVCYYCESERLMPQVQRQLEALAGELGMRCEVHTLCEPFQATLQGRLSHEWCALYSQCMAVALARAIDREITPEAFLRHVLRIMHRFIQQFTRR